MTTAPYASAALTRQPYLQSLTPTSVVVAWETDAGSGTDSVVSYGPDPANLSQGATTTAAVVASRPSRRQHEVLISGLSPNTRYYYAVGTGTAGVEAGGSLQYYFVTAPVAGSDAPFTMWVVGDSGVASTAQAQVRDALLGVLGGPPDLFLHVGDIAYNVGSNSEFTANHFAMYEDVLRHTPFFPVVGNHEASGGDSSSATQSGPYFEAFHLPAGAEAGGVPSGTEAYYSFDYGNVHLIMLDSDDSSVAPGSAQLTWLESDLAAVGPSTDWLVALFHHPPYSKGSHDSDSGFDSGGRMQAMREFVLPVLEAGGVDLVLSGHSHSYERSYLIDGVYGYGSFPNFVTPGFGTLQADGHIVDAGSGSLATGGYEKSVGVSANEGAVYLVTGHGGRSLSGSIDHPVMFAGELFNGSTLITVDANTLTVENVRSTSVISDRFVISKVSPECTQPSDCDDADACTSDSCVNQICIHDALNCDDSDACTSDSCDAALGCQNEVIDCDDANACTTDSCDAALGCQNEVVDCDDANACTTDSCDSVLGCQHAMLDCGDGDACTTDSCDVSLGCLSLPVDCDDADACTTDSCDATLGCQHTAVDCSDGDACTTDSCDVVSGCQYASVSCDDGNACTEDSCVPSSGCAHDVVVCAEVPDTCLDAQCDPAAGCVAVPNSASCDDGDACTVSDRCDQGTCGGPARDCSDLAGECVAVACEPLQGCVALSVANGTPCSTGQCIDGQCRRESINDVGPGDAGTPVDAGDAAAGLDAGGRGRSAPADPRPSKDAAAGNEAPSAVDGDMDAAVTGREVAVAPGLHSRPAADAGRSASKRDPIIESGGCDCVLSSHSAPLTGSWGLPLGLGLLLRRRWRRGRGSSRGGEPG